MNDKAIQTSDGQNRNPYTLWFVVLAFVAPVALAYYMFYFGSFTSFTNHGELYQPVVDITKLQLTDENGKLIDDKKLRYKWRFYFLLNGDCDTDCQKRLIEVRQLHKTFGKDAHRILKAVIYTAKVATTTQQFISTELPDAQVYYGNYDAIAKALNITSETNEIYICDPMGNIMMRFRSNQPIRELQFDMKKLLKASQIG